MPIEEMAGTPPRAAGTRARGWRTARSAGLALLALAGLAAPDRAAGQPVLAPETYAGDLWSRPRLTGDWLGYRDQLAKKGVVLDVELLLAPQGAVSGGRDTDGQVWGTAEYTLGLDTQKLGLWPGGFFKVYGMSGFGNDVQEASGAIVPVNTATVLPEPGGPASALMNLTFMQFLAKWIGVFAGKVYTLGGDANAFAHDYRSTFMNTGLDFNMTLALVPFSAFGGGVVVLPWTGASVTVSVVDPSGAPTSNDITEAFEDGVLVSGEGRVTVKPFGLVGHQLAGFVWSNKERLSLEQDPSNIARLLLTERYPRLANPGPVLARILARFFPELLVPAQPANTAGRTWAAYYNFDQYLWNPGGDPSQGIGVFFRFGVSDGKANPIKYAYNVGLGGKGIIPTRAQDTYGIGWSRVQFSDAFVPFLRRRLALGLDKEDAIELYYNAVLTGWLNASVDLQIVDPGLKKTLDTSGRLRDVSTAVVLGARVHARF